MFQLGFWGRLKKTACDGAQDGVAHDHKNGGGFAPLVGQRIDISVIGPLDQAVGSELA